MRDVDNLNDFTGKLEMLRTEFRRVVYDLAREWPEDAKVDLDIIEDKDTVDYFIHSTLELLKRGVTVVKPMAACRLLDDTTIFEGAQGVLLDEEWGFHPHTTWSDCTFNNALRIIKQFSGTKVTKIGVTRAYHTRHGAGPLPSQGLNLNITDHNSEGRWQGAFRLGHFDFVLARYARHIIDGVDEVVINHLDQVEGSQQVCIGHNFQGGNLYRLLGCIDHEMHQELEIMSKEDGEEASPVQSGVSPIYTELKSVDRLVDAIGKVFRAPVTIKGYGPTAEDPRDV